MYLTLYVTHLENILKNENNLNVDIYSILKDDNKFVEMYDKLRNEFIDLTQDGLRYLVESVLIEKKVLKELSELSEFKQRELEKMHDELYEKYVKLEKDNIFNRFNEMSSKFESAVDNIRYNDIELTIKGNNVEYGTEGIFIKLNELFNVIELNDNIPFIALGKKYLDSKNPQIKIYNNLINTVNDKEIKNWVLNEKQKANEVTYKIIKGLMIKSKLNYFKDNYLIRTYLTINLLQNGLLYINLRINDKKLPNDLNSLIDNIKKNVNNVISQLNRINGVFLKSKKIDSIENSKVMLTSIDSIIETSVFIDRYAFRNILEENVISENLFSYKDTGSRIALSAYYKKIQKNEQDESKGITVNIKDNPYKQDSSIITIYGANDQYQSLIIVWNMLILNKIANELYSQDNQPRKVMAEGNKAILKSIGINFDSKKCQAKRQPQLNNENKKPFEGSYTIIFKDQNFICNNPEYPYPGFTRENIACCFKINQTGNENYIRNIDPDSLNILVEPSNFKITIKKDGASFETFVIKIISEYRAGFDEGNSSPRYYYLSNTKNKLASQNDIIPIYNKALIEEIDKKDNIWLETVTLSEIIYPSAKCINKPDLNNRISINAPCSHHKKNKYFGYTANSVPCCFEKEPDEYITKKKKISNITTKYIIKSYDKLLNNNQIGILPYQLDTLFNKILKNEDSKALTESTEYYRMGIIQNKNAFLNALLLATDNMNNTIIDIAALKNNIVNNLNENQSVFNKLNKGDISIKYKNINNYIKYINNNDVFLNWLELVELFERIYKKNIIVLDIKDENIKILCRPMAFNIEKNPYIILLKRENVFEIIIQLIKKDKTDDIIKQYTNENVVIKFLKDYYLNSCIRENKYPENYKYIPLHTSTFVIDKLKNLKDGYIKYQIKNSFNKINMLLTNTGILIPILETGIIENNNIIIFPYTSLIKQQLSKGKPDTLRTLKNYVNNIDKINEMFGEPFVKIIGIMDSSNPMIGGILTNYGYTIPYKKEKGEEVFNIQKLDFKYYLDVDEKLNDKLIESTPYDVYNENNDKISVKLYEIKKSIGELLTLDKNKNIKNEIENIIIDTNYDKGSKINKIVNIIVNIMNKISPLDGIQNEILYKIIANEILNDNKEKLILNNIITKDSINKGEIIIRDVESVLLNINDIMEWVKKYK